MSEKTLKFNNIALDKKTFHKLKEPIGLLSLDLDRIVVFYKFKDNGEKLLLFFFFLLLFYLKLFLKNILLNHYALFYLK